MGSERESQSQPQPQTTTHNAQSPAHTGTPAESPTHTRTPAEARAQSQAQQYVDPRLEAAARVVTEWAGQDPEKSAYPGAVTVVVQNGHVLLRLAVGHAWAAQLAPPVQPMTVAHVFDVASITKTVATATTTLILLEQGRISLDDTVDTFLPFLRDSALGQVKVWHLLTHTAGFGEVPPLFELGYGDGRGVDYGYVDGRVCDSGCDSGCDSNAPAHSPHPTPGRRPVGNLRPTPADLLARVPLRWAPGTHVQYSCKGYIVLGQLLEAASDTPLDEFARRHIFEPLGMHTTSYMPLGSAIPEPARGLLVPSEPRSATPRGQALRAAWIQRGLWLDAWRDRHIAGDVPVGIVHDENAAWLGGVSGNAGLFSTADDLARFGQMWLDHGLTPDGRRLLSPATVELATCNYTGHLPGGDNRGLGWQLPSPDTSFGDYAPDGSLGVTGFSGTGLWVVPKLNVVAVLLTNRLQFTRRNDHISRVRRLFLNAVLASLS
ncbi:MAG: serine hydrolase domain-containing protein [Bacillota bacterium]|jgi:CubicO group peptidase (beta-lactamase class C family)